MQRLSIVPRPDWQEKFTSMGFSFHSVDGCYWDESVCYQFTEAEIDSLDDATSTLNDLCLQAVEYIISNQRYAELEIPPMFIPFIENAWRTQVPTLYGRFDLVYDGIHPPKLLEYNADTPTALFEAAVAQWHWLEDTGRPDQFNSLHEKLIDQWRIIAQQIPLAKTLYFSCAQDSDEDWVTLNYLRDTAMQAYINTEFCYIEDIGWDGQQFVDLHQNPIAYWFKLYPWEWLMNEDFGSHLLNTPVLTIEPAWKTLLSNKGLLPILWEMFPNHPNLLPAYREPAPLGNHYAIKPLFSREGSNITLINGKQKLATEGPYTGTVIYQQLAHLPDFSGHFPVIGSWIIGNSPAGIGIREDLSPITSNTSRFIPHFFEPQEPL